MLSTQSASYAIIVGDREEEMYGWNSAREGSPAFLYSEMGTALAERMTDEGFYRLCNAHLVPKPATLISLCLGSMVLFHRRYRC